MRQRRPFAPHLARSLKTRVRASPTPLPTPAHRPPASPAGARPQANEDEVAPRRPLDRLGSGDARNQNRPAGPRGGSDTSTAATGLRRLCTERRQRCTHRCYAWSKLTKSAEARARPLQREWAMSRQCTCHATVVRARRGVAAAREAASCGVQATISTA